MYEKRNLAFLSLLKLFLAVSIVFWHGVGCQFGFDFTKYKFLEIYKYMTVCGGNQVFLLISGMMFYLCYYTKLSENKLSIKDFVIKRSIRIYPLATIGTLLAFGVAVLRTLIFKGDNSFTFNYLFIDLVFFGNTLFRSGYGYYNGPIWYLAALLFCYASAILIVSSTRKKPHTAWFLIPFFVGIYMCETSSSLPFFNNPQLGTGLYNFYLGFFFMPVLKNINRLKIGFRIFLQIACFLFSVTMIYLFIKKNYSTTLFGSGDVAFNLVIWIPLFISLYGIKLNQIFDNKLFAFLGELSFHIYILHVPLNFIYTFLIDYYKISGTPVGGFIVYQICLFTISVLSVFPLKILTKFLTDKFMPKKLTGRDIANDIQTEKTAE